MRCEADRGRLADESHICFAEGEKIKAGKASKRAGGQHVGAGRSSLILCHPGLNPLASHWGNGV